MNQDHVQAFYVWDAWSRSWMARDRETKPQVITPTHPDWFNPYLSSQPKSCEERLASAEQELKTLKQKYEDDMNDLAKTAMGGTDPD